MKIKKLLQEIISRRKAFLDKLSGKQQYFTFALIVFFVSTLISYLLFRQGELSISVNLAKVEYKDQVSVSFDTQSQIQAIRSWDVVAKKSGRVDRLFAASGDEVKKGQILAMFNEAESRTNLENVLKVFKEESSKFGPTTEQYQKGRKDLELAKQNLEDNMVRAPADGVLWLRQTKVGDAIEANASLAAVEDLSQLIAKIRTPATTGRDIPHETSVTVSPPQSIPTDKAIAVNAAIRYASAKVSPTANESELEVVFTRASIPPSWLHEAVHLKILQKNLKGVALLDPNAVLSTKEGESKILVLSPFGTLHWQKVTYAPKYENKIAIGGTDPKTFRVVLPENPDLLNKAITLNSRPKIKNGG